MKEVQRLTRLFLSSQYGLSMLRYNRKHDSKAFFKQLTVPLIVLLCLAPVYGLYMLFCGALFEGLRFIHQTSVMLPLIFTLVSLIIIFFGIAEVMSEFFFSEDIAMLLHLPLKSRSILLGKYICMLTGEWILAFLFLLPPVIFYGVGMAMGGVYYLFALVTAVLLPMLPIAVESLLMMLLMRTSVLKGRKDLIQTIGLFVFLAVVVGIQLALNIGLRSSDDPTQLVNALLSDDAALLKQIGQLYPLAMLAAGILNTVSVHSVLYLLAFILLTAMSVWLMLVLGEKVFFRSISENRENSGKRHRNRSDRMAFKKESSQYIAVFKMDMRLLIRTPIYLYNNVSVVVLMPVIFAIMLFSTGAMEETSGLVWLYQEYHAFFVVGLTVIFLFFGMTSATTVSTFSREGKNIWLTQIVPVRPRDQILGRSFSALTLLLLGMFLTLVLVRWVVPLSAADLLLTLVLSVAGNIPLFLGGLLIDMYRPMLKWDNPQKAVKNNFNVVLLMLAGLGWMVASGGIMAAAAFLALPWAGYALYLLISIILSGIMFKACEKHLEGCLIRMSAES